MTKRACHPGPSVEWAVMPNLRPALAFPFLSASEVFEWVSRPQSEFDNDWIKELRNWVRRTLKPRVRGQNKKKR